MHEFMLEDDAGELVDVIALCSDSCHRDYAGDAYSGWNGCNESEFTTYCANCGVVIPGGDACEHQLTNVVVNRFISGTGEQCAHGNWIQLPGRMVPAIQERLEYLRTQLNAECISWGELAELQGLADYIEPGDVQLPEAAGIPEEEFAQRT